MVNSQLSSKIWEVNSCMDRQCYYESYVALLLTPDSKVPRESARNVFLMSKARVLVQKKWDLLENISVSSCFILPKLMASLGLIVGFI